MANISSKDQANYYLIVKGEVMLANNKSDKAKDAIDKLGVTYISDYHHLSYYLLSLRYYQQIGDLETWKIITNEFVQLKKFNENPMTYLTQAQLAQYDGKFDLAKNAFEQAKARAIKINSAKVIAKVLNPYILFLLEDLNEIKQAQHNLIEIEKHVVPDYPYLKVKAKVLFKQGEIFSAATTLEELKSKSGNLWTSEDQLLLENYHNQISINIK